MDTPNTLLERLPPRLGVTLRTLIAVGGGYVLAAGLSFWCAYFAGAEGREARTLISFWFFIAYATAIITLFAVSTHGRALTYAVVGNGVVWGAWWLIGGGA